MYLFHINFPKERRPVKILVYTMYLLDLAQTVSTTYFAWYMLVTGWGNPLVFIQVPWPGFAQPIFTGILAAIAQIYFSWRIYILKKETHVYRIVAVLIAAAALLQCAGGMANGIRLALASDVSTIATLETTVNIWLGGSFAVDIVIAMTMSFILFRARRRAISRRTNALLRRLIVSTVETGAVTAITAGADLFLYIENKENYIHLCPSLLLGKLYSIVVVASLNGRIWHDAHLPTSIHTSDFARHLGALGANEWAPGSPNSAMTGSTEYEPTVLRVPTKSKYNDGIESPIESPIDEKSAISPV